MLVVQFQIKINFTCIKKGNLVHKRYNLVYLEAHTNKMYLLFQISEGEVAPVNSLLAGFYLLAGPFISALANKSVFSIVI